MVKTNISKYDYFKTYYWHYATLIGKHRMPQIKPTQFIPQNVISFSECHKLKKNDIFWVDFFIDDYKFERVWQNCDKYIPILKKAKGIITPDFSMYPELHPDQRIWNCVRNRILSYYFQTNGLNIVPSLSWCELKDLEWCLDGIEKECSVAVSSNGCLSCFYSKKIFLEGINIIQNKISPSHIIICGRPMTELINYNNIYYYDCFSQRMHKRINRKK